ncbi:hypothetical protein HUK82_17010, partial [Ameyamaea chiangmaiensis]|nr:hypothetical protein [Ameyamaea chiangmaiensis]
QGVSACSPLMIDHLIGHKSQRLVGNTYAAQDFGDAAYRDAIMGTVEKGLPETVRTALEETAGKRGRFPWVTEG